MSQKYTLIQILKRTGQFTEKEDIVKAISKGRVSVDGKVTTCAKFQCNPLKRKVLLDSKEVELVPLMYFLLNKPQNYSCQKNDRYPYVVDLLQIDKQTKNSLFVMGRLDIPTTGLLIITNDGRLASRLMKPDQKVPKKYRVLCKGPITHTQKDELQDGIYIEVFEDEYRTLPAIVEKIGEDEIFLTITEGKFRQVRKMLEAVGNGVAELKRVSIGKLKLGNLEVGESKILLKEEMLEVF
jgi:16S rRNA pseudouridine516 synthase